MFISNEIIRGIASHEPVVEVYKAKQYNPIRRRLMDVVVKRPLCGVCGNPVTPKDNRRYCPYCGNNIKWNLPFVYGKPVRIVKSLKGFKNIQRVKGE